jgi:tetratricopeptide (TPR) repeat protein
VQMHSRNTAIARIAIFLASGFGPCAMAQTSNPDPIGQYSDEGRRALAEGRYSDAEIAFEKLRQLEPNVAEVHANLGAIYFQERKFQQAVPALRQALKLKPGLARSQTLLALSLSETGHYEEAAAGLEKGFASSDDPEVRRMCGLQLQRVYSGLQRDDKAVEVALQLNRSYPNDAEVLYHSGRIFGNYAYLSARHLGEVAPNSIWTHLASGEASESQGSYDLAITEYRQVLRLDPRRPGVHYRLGRSILARGAQAHSQDASPEAQKEFAAELEIDPTNANAAYELGEAHQNLGEMDEAEKFFRLALKYYPGFEQANLGLAAVLLKGGKPAPAREYARKAVAENPLNQVAWYRLRQIEKALGNPAGEERALAEFQRLREKSNAADDAKRLFSLDEVTPQKPD